MRKGKDYELEPVTRFVLLTLANYADPEGNDIYPSLGTLEADTGLSERTIRRHIKTLMAVGLLDYGDQEVVKLNPRIRADQRPKVYRFLFERDEGGSVDFGGFGKMPPSKNVRKPQKNDRTQSPPVTTGQTVPSEPVDNSADPQESKGERPDSESITTGHTTGQRVHQTIKPKKINQAPTPPTPEEVEAGRLLREQIRQRNAQRGTFAQRERQHA
jgi:hypothetical protein